MALEEVKFLQKQRQRKSGIPALINSSDKDSVSSALTNNASSASDKNKKSSTADQTLQEPAPEKDKDDLVLQDTFAQETAVMVEDPNMLKYVEQELAKKRGRVVEEPDQAETELKRVDDELYRIPDHLKVKKRNSEESSTQWTTGIAEIQLPIEYKLKNIEETEAAKKVLQEKRLTGCNKSELSIPSSFSADYFQRGRDYAEKLRREHPELYNKEKSSQDKDSGGGGGSKQPETASTETAVQRQAATDEFMLNRFRKRERARVMRR